MKVQLPLQKLLNQILELSCNDFTTEEFLKQSFHFIINQSGTLGVNKRGVIFLVKEPEKLKMLAHKNIEKKILSNCKLIKYGSCACGMAAQENFIHQASCTAEDNEIHSNNHGHYSIPISYNNKVYGVISLYISNEKSSLALDANSIKIIADTIGLIIYKKQLEKKSGLIKNKLDLHHGEKYFFTLAKYLTKVLDMKHCFIGGFQSDTFSVNTFAFVENNKKKSNITYSLLNTPCENVYNNAPFVFIEKDVVKKFPKDEYLKKLNAESYIGIRLENEKKQPVGLIVLLNDKPIDNLLQKQEIIDVFIPRLTSEVQRKNYENQLILNELKYKDVIDKFQDVFLRVSILSNGKSIISEVSPSVYSILGYKPAEVVGKPTTIFYQDVNQRNEMMNLLIQETKIKNFPLSLLNKKGGIVYVEATVQLIFDNKKPVEIRAVIRDVTEKRKEELRREIAYLIAKKSQRQLVNIKAIAEYVYFILKNIVETTNFYIAVNNSSTKTIDFLVFHDEKITDYPTIHSSKIKNGLIEYFFRQKNTFCLAEKQLVKLIAKEQIHFTDPIPKVMLNFPLKCDGMVMGVLTLKSYKSEKTFSENDVVLLEFVATQLSNILERDHWQRNLMAKEKYFRELIEKSNEVTGIVDENGVVQFITSSVFPILQYHNYELIGKPFIDFVVEKKKKETWANFINYTKNEGNIPRVLIKLKSKQDEPRIVEISINNQLKNKDINGIVFNAHDITEQIANQKKLEQSKKELQEQEESYRTIFDNANDGIMRFNTSFKIIDCNQRMTSILGYSKNEYLNKTIFDLTLPKDVNRIQNRIDLLVKGKIASLKVEKESIHKTGKKIICKVFIKPVFNDDNTINYFIAFITDITKRNEAINKALVFERALNSVSNVMYVDTKGIIMYSNDKVSISSGYTPNELLGKSMSIFNSNYHPKEFFSSLWKTVLSGKIWNGEIRNKRKDGSFYWIFGIIIPIKNLDNEIEYFINIRQDITEVKNNRLNRIRDVIDAQEKEKENFAKELHDGLGQMLLAAKMNLVSIENELKNTGGFAYEIYQNALKILNESIIETRNISHGLMSRALLQFGLTQAIYNVINNVNLIDSNVVIQFNSEIGERRFSEDIEKGLYRVIQELINNLIKHSEASCAKIELKLVNNYLIINYYDNGVGICNNLINLSKPIGIGIRNMETRVNYLMGSFTINEELTTGSEITIKIPI
ncbi:MAG: hypothetical protein KFKLKKLM_00765 [Flavobacteriales bacterium]|nr:hypothetical protein [Flavobacteriales bacterium]